VIDKLIVVHGIAAPDLGGGNVPWPRSPHNVHVFNLMCDMWVQRGHF